MARNQFNFQKRRKEQEKKKKRAEKLARRRERKARGTSDADEIPTVNQFGEIIPTPVEEAPADPEAPATEPAPKTGD